MRKPRILFVGAFSGVQKGNFYGGQLYRCQSLVDSELGKYVEWILINSSLQEIPPPSFVVRVRRAFGRVVSFMMALIRQRPDIVMVLIGGRASIFEKGLMLTVAKSLGGCRCVCSPASGFIQGYFSEPFMSWVLRFVFDRSDVIVCQGNWWKQFYLSKCSVPDERFVVRPNWIQIDKYNIHKVERNSDSVVRILYLGWMVDYKGVLDLLEAVKLVRGRVSQQIELIACGDGPVLTRAKELSRELGIDSDVQFPGFVDFSTKLDLFSRSDIFVLPSHTEGMPNALMEAMLCGKACIATRVGGVRDLIPSSNIGRVVPPREPKKLASALEELITTPAERVRLGAAARRQVIENHSIEQAWPEMYEVLTGEAISKRSGN
jgi:glycosyltransferase involved in cell wall biosynthesis